MRAVESVLRDAGHGILSVSTDDGVHARPMSFGYDGSRLYFQLGTPTGATESPFAAAGGEAELVVSEVTDVDDWHSVVVRAPLELVSPADEQRAFRALADNAVVPHNALGFGECRNFQLASMRADAASGRGGPASTLVEDSVRPLDGPMATD